MNITDNTMAHIEFRLEWESEYAKHTEGFFGQEVNIWRDCFPKGFHDALMGARIGDVVTLPCTPDETPSLRRSPNGVFTIKPAQFQRRFGDGHVLVPRAGRFYPKGVLKDIPNVFPANMEPFRCGRISENGITVDFNHPLAGRELTIKAIVRDIWPKTKERGGVCHDWVERLMDGPGMQVRWNGLPTEFFDPDAFLRDDPSADGDFYEKPRFVQHVDARAREVIRELYSRLLKPGMQVLDLMASWESHLPTDLKPGRVVGLGLNQEELAANPRLSQRVTRDLNATPTLPFAAAEFDAVLCTVSVEYLVHPHQVFAEIARVLKPEGLVVMTFSNRWFPTKAVKVWREIHEFERLGLVMEYFLDQGRFHGLETYSMRGLPRPEDDKYYGTLWMSDPVYAAWGRRA
ncbi:MAG: methyltransferase domain-containing protein [Thermodesulfobacteriota bacterium]